MALEKNYEADFGDRDPNDIWRGFDLELFKSNPEYRGQVILLALGSVLGASLTISYLALRFPHLVGMH